MVRCSIHLCSCCGLVVFGVPVPVVICDNSDAVYGCPSRCCSLTATAFSGNPLKNNWWLVSAHFSIFEGNPR